MMNDQSIRLEKVGSKAGAILRDAALPAQVDDDWFSPAFWQHRDRLQPLAGGRGGVAVIDTPVGQAVLRHYRRGGFVAGLLGDRYLWTGAEASRGFAELRLLGEINRQGLPAPRAVAARYQRRGIFYQADLITLRIADSVTLAQCLASGHFDAPLAAAVGELVARFHRAGIWHADLNAHNVLVRGEVLYLIDFDRCRRRPPALGWRLGNLRRLRRSLLKLGAGSGGQAHFEQFLWQPLLAAYQRVFSA